MSRKINYESDFKLIEGFKDGSSMAEAPFKFTYYTKLTRGSFIAEYDGNVFTNCRLLDDGRLVVAFDNPNLGMGSIFVKREFFLNDEDFGDGICKVVSIEDTGIILDKGSTDDLGEIELIVEKYYHSIGSGYEPPEGGIPLDDLSEEVQESLMKANSAIQSEETEHDEQVDDYTLMGSDIAQELGDSPKKIVSQSAINEAFINVNSEISNIKSSLKLYNLEISTLTTEVNSLKKSIITVLNTAI